jgi:putative phosphoribosyl transferase
MYRLPVVVDDDDVPLVPDAVLVDPVAPVVPVLVPVLGVAFARTNWLDPLVMPDEPVVPVVLDPVAVEPEADVLAFSRQPTTVIVFSLVVPEVLGVCAATPIAHVAAIARPVAHRVAFISPSCSRIVLQARHQRAGSISHRRLSCPNSAQQACAWHDVGVEGSKRYPRWSRLMSTSDLATPRPVRLDLPGVALNGDLSLGADARGLVVFAHGSGSSRHSSRNRAVAEAFQHAGLATLLLDLLTEGEDRTDEFTAEFRFNIPLLADRVVGAIDWAQAHPATETIPIGVFGASTGAAAAIIAAAARPAIVRAVVSRGGRADLAGSSLDEVSVPTLLIVGGRDDVVLQLNRDAFERLKGPRELQIVDGATHLFPEPGALERVAELARDWFVRYLR